MSPLLLLLSGCTSTILVNAEPENAFVYVTDYRPDPNHPPQVYEAAGPAPLYCDLNYYAWEDYYVWVGAEGYQTQVMNINNEIKVGPVIGSVCLFPTTVLWLVPLIWAWGPEDDPMYFRLEPEKR